MDCKYNILAEKLEDFIRKYYKNRLFRGSLLGSLLIISYYLVVIYLEYLSYFSVTVRTLIVGGGFILFLYVVLFMIIIPLLRLIGLKSRLSYREASIIISNHFPSLQDKLINTIELANDKDDDGGNADLIIASINNRIEEIKPIPFPKAVSLKQNRRYLAFLGIVMAIGFFLWFLSPHVYLSGGNRLVNFRQEFQPPAPFRFVLLLDSLEVEKGDDFSVSVQIQGEYVPSVVYCCYSNSRFRMKYANNNTFSYLFRNVNSPVNFYFFADNFYSDNYLLEVLFHPSVLNFSATITPPLYTGIDSLQEYNRVDFSVPEGSHVKWNFVVEQTDSLWLQFDADNIVLPAIYNGSNFSCSAQLWKSSKYIVCSGNSHFHNKVLMEYMIDVIPDRYPQIEVVSLPDSTNPSIHYFKGVLSDDYGFSNLSFIFSTDDKHMQSIPVDIDVSLDEQEFYFAVNFAELSLEEGNVINYFFEVFDNDGVNGPKSSRSQESTFLLPTAKQIFDLSGELQDSLSKQFENGIGLSRSIQSDLQRLQESFINSPGNDWQRQQYIKLIGEKRQQLEAVITEIQRRNIKKNLFLNSYNQQDSLLRSKQEQIEELLSNVMDDQLKKLLNEFDQLTQELKSKEFNNIEGTLNRSLGDFEQLLDRNLELLKRYEVENLYKELTNRIDRLSSSQENSDVDSLKDLIYEQKRDESLFENIINDYNEILKLNFDLKSPFGIDSLNSDFDDIKGFMHSTFDMLNNNNLNRARRNRRNTAVRLKDLSNKMKVSMSQDYQAQLSVDSGNLMGLLDDLVEFSLEQEDLMLQLRNIDYRDPIYSDISIAQIYQREKFYLLRDSLLQLSSNSTHMALKMGDKVFDIEQLLDQIMDIFQKHQKHRILMLQQNIMTQVNDLALLLSEVLQAIKEQMSTGTNGMPDNDSKGRGTFTIPDLRTQQLSLKKQLEQMIRKIKHDMSGKSGLTEDMVRMLKAQEMYRKAVNDLMINGDLGVNNQSILKDVLKLLDQTEVEIANFSINSNTLKRQNFILTRLLEVESAERERDLDSKRESSPGNSMKLSNPREIFEYKRIQINFDDNFHRSNVKLFDYYNKLYLDYLIKLNND